MNKLAVLIGVVFLILILILVGICFFKNADMSKNLPNETIYINGEEYTLTFADDFNGDKLNKAKWSLCPEYERQDVGGFWNDECVSLDGNGNLVLTAKINEKAIPISGAIRSRGKFEQEKGYFEIRCKLQNASGFWGAFWLMCDGANHVGNGAINGAEIDIFESFDVYGGGINHALHWDGYGKDHKTNSKSVYNKDLYDGEYHTFSLLWTDEEYIFYIDGEESWRLEGNVCNKKCYLKITTEFGSWAGRYVLPQLPDSITVDYVKVYEKKK